MLTDITLANYQHSRWYLLRVHRHYQIFDLGGFKVSQETILQYRIFYLLFRPVIKSKKRYHVNLK